MYNDLAPARAAMSLLVGCVPAAGDLTDLPRVDNSCRCIGWARRLPVAGCFRLVPPVEREQQWRIWGPCGSASSEVLAGGGQSLNGGGLSSIEGLLPKWSFWLVLFGEDHIF